MPTNYKHRPFVSCVKQKLAGQRRPCFDFTFSVQWEIESLFADIDLIIGLLHDQDVADALCLHAILSFFSSGQVDAASWTRLYGSRLLPRIRDCLESDDDELADLSMCCLGIILQGLPTDASILLLRDLESYGILDVVFEHFTSEDVSPAALQIFFSLADQLVTIEPHLPFVDRPFQSLLPHLTSELQNLALHEVSPTLWVFLRSLSRSDAENIRQFLLDAFAEILQGVGPTDFSCELSELSRLDIIATLDSLCALDPDAASDLCGDSFPVVLLRHLECVQHDQSEKAVIRFLANFMPFARDKSILYPFFVAMVSIYRPRWVELAINIAHSAFPTPDEPDRRAFWAQCAAEVFRLISPALGSNDAIVAESTVQWARCMAAFAEQFSGNDMVAPLTPLFDLTTPSPALSLSFTPKLFYAECLAAGYEDWLSPNVEPLVNILCELLASDMADERQTNMFLELLMRFVVECNEEDALTWLNLLDGLGVGSQLFPSLAERGCEIARALQEIEEGWRARMRPVVETDTDLRRNSAMAQPHDG
jgi:hypothetical protein